MNPSSNQSAKADTSSNPQEETDVKKKEKQDDGFEWDFGDDEDEKEKKSLDFRSKILPLRSGLLIELIEYGLPKEQRGMFYFLLVQFHEDFDSQICVFSALPALLMWYFPQISPLMVYTVTRGISIFRESKYKDVKDSLIPIALYTLSSSFFARLANPRGSTEAILEPIFGSSSKWPAALLPIFPGMFLRMVDERPNSINGFVPENMQGIVVAVFIKACTAVISPIILWPIWALYAAPSTEYPSMFIEWVICTFSWIITGISPLGAYAIWLMVNQYRHTRTWFRLSGGGPSVILKRERSGTWCYIATVVVIQLVENAAGVLEVDTEFLTLPPQVWIPFGLMLVIGIHLLKYGLLLRMYKYKHEPLRKGKTIRLLRLRAQPCLPNSPIQCDMIVTTLRRPPQYVAVSHRWDAVGATQEMILIDGGLFPVFRSIYSLLLAKRTNLHHRYFWIDSICINQDDKVEKSRQVGMMRNIFEEAEMTIGWLGDSPGAEKAFNLIEKTKQLSSVESFSKLQSDPESGWHEFEELMSNEWFERAWIVQEIAVARAQILRYGGREIEWETLTHALTRIMTYGFGIKNDLSSLLDRREILNALIMEEVKSKVADVDFIRLKDALKLGLRFKATLPIDKVYAVLGLVEERHTPLFHPKFGISGGKNFDSRMLWNDAAATVQLLGDILGTATGSTNSRRGRAILSSGTDNALRYTAMLVRDMEKINTALKKVRKGTTSFEEEDDPIRPDYSDKTNALLIYAYVARDLVKHDDGFSFLPYAGTGFSRNSELPGLPSWVPDWSTDVQVYLLPWLKRDKPVDTGIEKDSKNAQPKERIFHDGGPQFLFIKGLMVDTIAHSTILTQDYDAIKCVEHDELEKDFVQVSTNFQKALELAREHAKSYQTTDAVVKGFYRSITASPDLDSSSSLNSWIPGISPNCSISASLWPEEHKDYWKRFPNSDDPEVVRRHQADNLKLYHYIRRARSSANAKFAHLVREDIVPSFSYYRMRMKGQKEKPRISILSKENTGPLLGYSPFVDYSIGRCFFTTQSGSMGIAPAGSREGDVIVQLQIADRVVWLVLREEESPDFSQTGDVTSPTKRKTDLDEKEKESLRQGTYRLVGEAFVVSPNSKTDQTEEKEWFKLW